MHVKQYGDHMWYRSLHPYESYSSNAREYSQVKHTLLTMALHLTDSRSFGFLSALYRKMQFLTAYQHKLIAKCCLTHSMWFDAILAYIFSSQNTHPFWAECTDNLLLVKVSPHNQHPAVFHHLLYWPMGLINWVYPIVVRQNWAQHRMCNIMQS